jgi:NAD(P)-dependent dehydrogenase (short-subunit alcohol dehydrogenase family)
MAHRPRLHGRVAFVTGGARGIGGAICNSLAEQGADVAAGYSRDSRDGRGVHRQAHTGGPEGQHSPRQTSSGGVEAARELHVSVFDAIALLIAMFTLGRLPIGPSIGPAAAVLILGDHGIAAAAAGNRS